MEPSKITNTQFLIRCEAFFVCDLQASNLDSSPNDILVNLNLNVCII